MVAICARALIRLARSNGGARTRDDVVHDRGSLFETSLEFLAELVARNRRRKRAALSNANRAGFFAHHDDDAIGLFGDSNRRAVARTKFGGEVIALREWQLHAGTPHAPPANHERQVVQRRIRPEDALKKRGTWFCVEFYTAREEVADPDAALDDDQRAEAILREELGGFRDVGGQARDLRTRALEEIRSSDPAERRADFRLEDHDEENREQIERAVEEKAQALETVGRVAEDAHEECHRDGEEEKPLDDARATRSAEESEDRVDDEPNHRQLDEDNERVSEAGSVEIQRHGPRSYVSDRIIAAP